MNDNGFCDARVGETVCEAPCSLSLQCVGNTAAKVKRNKREVWLVHGPIEIMAEAVSVSAMSKAVSSRINGRA